MNLIGKEAHVSYDYGGSVATVFGTITGIQSLQKAINIGTDKPIMVGRPQFIEMTDGEDIRYIPVEHIIHIHIGKLE